MQTLDSYLKHQGPGLSHGLVIIVYCLFTGRKQNCRRNQDSQGTSRTLAQTPWNAEGQRNGKAAEDHDSIEPRAKRNRTNGGACWSKNATLLNHFLLKW